MTYEELEARGWALRATHMDRIVDHCTRQIYGGAYLSLSLKKDGSIERLWLNDLIQLAPQDNLFSLESLIALLTGKEQTCEWKVAWRNYYIGGFSKTYDS